MKLDRSIIPAPKGEIEFVLPEIKHLKTSQDLEVLFVRKTNLPIIQISLILNAGSYFDPDGKFGLAKLAGMMIDEGAGKYNALELDNKIDSLGTILEISNDHDSTFMSMLSMKQNFKESLDLFSMILCEPHFPEEDFKREKHKAIVRTIQYMDDPSYIASTEFEKIILNGTGYQNPIPGTEETLNNISLDELKTFHSKHFNSNNCKLVVVGDIDESELLSLINTSFEKLPKGENFSSVKTDYQTNSNLFLYHKEGSSQSELRVGLPTSRRKEGNYFARLLLNSVLGGQFSSRINLNLREDKGYTYGAHSAFSYTKTTGHFSVSTSVQTENTANALNEIKNEILKIKDGVTKEELEFSKSYLIKKFPSMFETFGQISRNLNTKVVFDLPDNYFNNYIENISSQTIEKLLLEAEAQLIDEDLTYLIVGDKNVIQKQLQDSFNKEIILLN